MACETCTCISEITDEQKEKVREIINGLISSHLGGSP
jgi:hypothetical protein